MIGRMKKYMTQPVDIVLFRKGREVTEHQLAEFFTDPAFTYLHDLHLYAIFSHAVYCDIVNGHAEDKGVKVKIPENWRMVEPIPSVPDRPGSVDIDGLKYQVWENPIKNKVIIAFRGTRFTNWRDWYANINFLTRFIPGVRNHYGKVKDLIPGLVSAVQNRMGTDVEIISTGHSLGGGLAQLAAYMSPHINLVYTFASSPVTGYRSVKKKARLQNQKNTLIARIFEHGEVLAYIRFFLKKVVTLSLKDPEINEVRFNFSESNAISEHSMGKLAEHIIIQSPHIDNDENYRNIA